MSNYGLGWDSATYDSWRTREPDDIPESEDTVRKVMGFFWPPFDQPAGHRQFFVVKGDWSEYYQEWVTADIEEWNEEGETIPEEYEDIPPNLYSNIIDKVMAEKTYDWLEEA
jgi:hypothetical protein